MKNLSSIRSKVRSTWKKTLMSRSKRVDPETTEVLSALSTKMINTKSVDAVGIEPTTFHMRSENHTPRPSALDSKFI